MLDQCELPDVSPADSADPHTGNVYMREGLAKACFESLLEFSFSGRDYCTYTTCVRKFVMKPESSSYEMDAAFVLDTCARYT